MYTEFLTGPAGCGKTYEFKRRIRENDLYGVMVSTTGVSAINLGTTTINSPVANSAASTTVLLSPPHRPPTT